MNLPRIATGQQVSRPAFTRTSPPRKQRIPDATARRLHGLAVWWLTLALPVSSLRADSTNLFFTAFERAEGYDTNYTLIGQNGWLGTGTGGNGLVPDFFPGEGQQAYIGYWPPLQTNETETIIWRPLNFNPAAAGLPLVELSVLMSVEDSSAANGQYDNFQWQIYNDRTNRLFTLDFDNYHLDISYRLDGTNDWVVTPVKFTNGVPERLVITMDFAANRWSATYGGRLVATNQPITTTGLPLTLGEIDLVWAYYDPNRPGDNYLLFDNFRVTARAAQDRPRLLLLERTNGGHVWLRLLGQPGVRYVIESTPTLVQPTWLPLRTNSSGDGVLDFIDTTAVHAPARFYRARVSP